MADVVKREDKWNAGNSYEPYVGRWSRLVAAEFVDWLDVAKGGRWLDVGCGTGALTETILNRAAPEQVVGVDTSEAFLGFARSRLDEPRIELRTADACALPIENTTIDVAVSGLVLNFVPEPAKVVIEMKRAVRPGGIVAVFRQWKVPFSRHHVQIDPSRLVVSTTTPTKPYSLIGSCAGRTSSAI